MTRKRSYLLVAVLLSIPLLAGPGGGPPSEYWFEPQTNASSTLGNYATANRGPTSFVGFYPLSRQGFTSARLVVVGRQTRDVHWSAETSFASSGEAVDAGGCASTGTVPLIEGEIHEIVVDSLFTCGGFSTADTFGMTFEGSPTDALRVVGLKLVFIGPDLMPGPAGPTGPAGPRYGPIGPTGPPPTYVGPTGPTGLTGPRGPMGFMGQAGGPGDCSSTNCDCPYDTYTDGEVTLGACPAGYFPDAPEAVRFETGAPSRALEISSEGDVQVAGYVQLATVSGAPAPSECDEDREYGRMVVDPTAELLYVCSDRGWSER